MLLANYPPPKLLIVGGAPNNPPIFGASTNAPSVSIAKPEGGNAIGGGGIPRSGIEAPNATVNNPAPVA